MGSTTIIEPRRGILQLDLKGIWEYRELLYFLVWRDVKVRYKQTAIGIGWALLQPLMTMLIFSVVFGLFARIPSDGLPYPLFAYTAILPWTYFATAFQRCSGSVVSDSHLLTKVYFPRVLLPLAGTMSGLVDFFISFVLLLGLLTWYRITIGWSILLVPVLLFLALLSALAMGLWLSALNVRYRDVGHALPFVIQLWFFLTPVVYPISMIPERYRLAFSLNPMAGVVEGFRWAVLGKGHPDLFPLLLSVGAVIVILGWGLVFFRNLENTFADVV
jgi:lipopolysaccharide transport system permease protein